MTERTVRMGGVAAVIFVVLVLTTLFSGGSPPAVDDSADEIRTYFVDNRSALMFGNLVGLLAIPFLVWFAVVLREVLRGDRLADVLGLTALAGLLVTVPMSMAGGAIFTSPVFVDGAAEDLGDDTLRLVFSVQSLLFTATAAGGVVFSLAAALAIRRTGALPTYTMWLALLATVGNVVAMFSTLGADAAVLSFPGLFTFAIFVLVTGITIAVGKATPTTTEAAEPDIDLASPAAT